MEVIGAGAAAAAAAIAAAAAAAPAHAICSKAPASPDPPLGAADTAWRLADVCSSKYSFLVFFCFVCVYK